MRRILLTIDDPTRDDRDYIVCDTNFTEPEIASIVTDLLKEKEDAEHELSVFEIMELLEQDGIITVVPYEEIQHDWIEVQR